MKSIRLSKDTLHLLAACGDEKDMEDAKSFLRFDRFERAYSTAGGILVNDEDLREEECQ